MDVLIVGGGGREHALAWKLKQSTGIRELFIAPGNPGTALFGKNIDATSTDEIVRYLQARPVDLVIVGPDNYLAEGLTDRVRELGIAVFGPSKAAAEIEWSKAYAKQLMMEEGIPTARSATFDKAELARKYVRTQSLPVVLKADGLAFGKGVVIARTYEEAETAVDELMNGGGRLVIEEYLEGLEVSVHALCDGENVVPFPISKDHKRIGEGDTGPNTGGMGTVAPVALVSPEQVELIQQRIIHPTLYGLAKRGRPFQGLLFPGIMLTKDGPYVIEFNARFGDPETQSYVRLLESDLLEVLYACATGTLKETELTWSTKSACCVVIAGEGYPGEVKKGTPIDMPDTLPEQVTVFHAGTSQQDGKLVTNGGRLLGITATGETLAEALEAAYAAAEAVRLSGKQYRRDIGASLI